MLARGGGAIVFTSSFVGTSVGLPGMAAYGAAKAALMGLVKGLTADYAVKGIRANALLRWRGYGNGWRRRTKRMGRWSSRDEAHRKP